MIIDHDHVVDVCDHADNRDHPSYIHMDKIHGCWTSIAGANIIVWSV